MTQDMDLLQMLALELTGDSAYLYLAHPHGSNQLNIFRCKDPRFTKDWIGMLVLVDGDILIETVGGWRVYKISLADPECTIAKLKWAIGLLI